MSSILVPIAFGYIVFVGLMNFIKPLKAIIAGVIAFLITLAYSVFDLPDTYMIVLIILVFVFVLVSLMLLKIKR